MKIKEAFLDLIICIALEDNRLHHNEKIMIKNFIDDNFEEDFNIEKRIEEIESYDKRYRMQVFENSVYKLNNYSEEKKIILIKFILNLILSDNKLTVGEKKCLILYLIIGK